MRLWKMEFYKIAARPVMNVGFLVILGFLFLVFYQEVKNARTEIDGKVYQGAEAIRMDQQLAKEYEGIFTMEKAEEIVGRFGFSGYTDDGGKGKPEEVLHNIREGNYCSQFVTDHMTDFRQNEEKPTGFAVGEAWENYGKNYVSGNVHFGYVKGWSKLVDVWNMAVIFLNVWLILMTAPVFSEEYNRNITGILLSTRHGKTKDIRAKILAALGFGGIVYLLVTVLLTGMTFACYGKNGLNASSLIIGDMFWVTGNRHWTVAAFLALMFFEGLVSVFLNICITLFLSSKCRRPATAVTAGILLFLLPYGVNKILFDILLSMGVASSLPGWIFMDIMRIFCMSLPIYLPFLEYCYVPSNWLALVPVIVLTVTGLSIWRSYVNYKNCQLP